MMEVAVLMMAYGGPASLDDVEAYLLDVRGGRPTSPELVAEIRRHYALIGGKSPLLEITQAQAEALEERLNQDTRVAPKGGRLPTFRVYTGMRHWHPYIGEAAGHIAQDGLRQVIGLCMAPHYSAMSIGAYFQKLDAARAALNCDLDVFKIESWHTHPLLIQALAEKVEAALGRFPADRRDEVKMIFSAHSLPAILIEQGDPYDAQVRETAHLLAERLHLPANRWQLSYQSAGAGGARWLGPAIEDVIAGMGAAGERDILVAPIGFVADHVETLYDIDIECQAVAGEHGMHLERTEALNTSPTFIDALAGIVRCAWERAGAK